MVDGNGRDLVLQHRDKIRQCLQECIERMLQTPDHELLSFMREQNASLIEWLDDEARWLAIIAGEKVEPKQHKVYAIMLPAGGAAREQRGAG
jgi:hypothetical protein